MRIDVNTLWDGRRASSGEAVTVTLQSTHNGLVIHVDAPHHNDPIPDSPPGPVDGLWEYEVVEVFVAGPGEPVPYTEIEIGPHGHHLVLTLRGVRQATHRCVPLSVELSGDASRWRARALVDEEWLPPRPWRVNVTAIHGVGAERRYLSSVPLAGEAPDFHQPDAFMPFR